MWKRLPFAMVPFFAIFANGISGDAASLAKPLPRFGVFVYSNLCWEKQSGDAAGYRLTLLRSADGNHILFEWSEGPLYEAAGYKVVVDARTSEISFGVDLPGAPREPAYSQTYTGEISSEALLLRSNDVAGRKYRLPLVRDFSRKIDFCS